MFICRLVSNDFVARGFPLYVRAKRIGAISKKKFQAENLKLLFFNKTNENYHFNCFHKWKKAYSHNFLMYFLKNCSVSRFLIFGFLKNLPFLEMTLAMPIQQTKNRETRKIPQQKLVTGLWKTWIFEWKWDQKDFVWAQKNPRMRSRLTLQPNRTEVQG